MIYQLNINSDNTLTVSKNSNRFFVIPTMFEFYKNLPKGDNYYLRVISIKFSWLVWDYKLLIRKKKKK